MGEMCCPVLCPYVCTDRPRCYNLMQEDFLWCPLQSACSMQQLRSVLSSRHGRASVDFCPPTYPNPYLLPPLTTPSTNQHGLSLFLCSIQPSQCPALLLLWFM